MNDSKILKHFTVDALNEFNNFSEAEKMTFLRSFELKRKHTWVAYLRFTILCLNSHHIYLDLRGKWVLWILYQATLGGFFLWTILDFILMPTRVRGANTKIATSIISEIKQLKEAA